MRVLFPLVFSIVFILVFGLIQILFFRYFNREWWNKRWLRRVIWILPLIGVVSVIVWGIGEYYTLDWLAYPGIICAFIIFISEACLIFSLPVSGIFHFLRWSTDKISQKKEMPNEKIDKNRRKILRSAAAAIPLLSLSAGATGIVSALNTINVYKRPIKIKNLPVELNGLRIFHLSDLHLRHYVTLENLEEILNQASAFKPHLTLVTGDIADELSILPDAVKIIEAFESPLGHFSSMGNHEYYRGEKQVKEVFSRSNTPLLIDRGIRITHNGYPVYIGGVDDPLTMGSKNNTFFKNSIAMTMYDSNEDDFKILMSHRPDALDTASETDIKLVLSGHTHGGQIGFNGRSLFEFNWPDRYLWGEYTKNDTKLYTSSGAGHWFPFRLGCPAEAPIIELIPE